MFATRKYLLIATAVATTVILSACTGGSMAGMDMGQTNSNSNQSSMDASAAFNDADVTFAQRMIPHHTQAVEMSDVILVKTGIDQRVLDLATQIKAAQEPEIKQLKTWLAAWGASSSGMTGMDHGTDGMMSQNDMGALNSAIGTDASKLFLGQMMTHHQGAIKMAQSEIDWGRNSNAKKMAQAIVKTQTNEISAMKDLLGTL